MKRLVAVILMVAMVLAMPGMNIMRGSSVEAAVGENIAYMRTVTASSSESDEHKPEYAVDANGSTRWSSQYADNQNLIVDLWSVQTVAAVKIAWEAAYASQFQVQVSTDNSTWQTVYENYNATGGTMEINFTPVQARYVKIYCIKRATEYGFSIYEFEIYGQNSSSALSNIKGKTFFFLGSSVTYGYASNGVSFVDYISQRNDCTCVKEAVSGTTLVDNGSTSYVQRMKNNFNTNAKCDHFVCQLSTNDASQNKPLGSMSNSTNLADFDTSTIYGAMEYIICYAKQTWNCPVTFYTNTYYDNQNYQNMVNALYQLKNKWDIGIIDLWNNQDMRNVSSSDYNRYMSDNIHPTAAGYLEWWTPVFEDYFQNFDYSNYITVSDAAKAKQNVLDYLYSIKGQKTVIGMHNREPNSEPAKQTNQVHEWTGKYPGLWSGDFLFSSSDVNNRWNMIYECKNQWESGSIVQLMLHVVSPAVSEPGSWDGGVVSHLSDAQWNDLITDGGYLNGIWKQRLDNYATYLQYLEDNGVPVLFRPFHEMNQGIFWWAGRKGWNGTGALFRLTRDYLENVKGLDNLIWVWDMQDLSYDWSDYNPGNDYWDIFAVDVYNSDYFTSYKYNQALNIAGNKLMAVGECQKLPTSAELYAQPNWCFVMSWAELTFQYNTGTEIQNLYWADNVIVREELPNLRDVGETPTQAPTQQPTTVQPTTVQPTTQAPETEQPTMQEPSDPYDLKLAGITYPTNIKSGDDVTFTALVQNNSSTDVPAGAQIRFTVDGTTVSTKTAQAVSAYSSTRVSATWKATAGGHTIAVTIDPNGALNSETPKTNNSASKKFNVETSINTDYTATSGADLYVTDISYYNLTTGQKNGSISAGDQIVWAANGVNAGNTAIGSGTKIGVQYQVDGQVYPAETFTWCDSFYGPLAGGAFYEFRANGGTASGTDKNIWIATNGTHSIMAWIDDSGLIGESNENNNQTTKTITVPYTAPQMIANPDEPDNLDNIQDPTQEPTTAQPTTQEPTTVQPTTQAPTEAPKYTVTLDGTVVATVTPGTTYTFPTAANVGYFGDGKLYRGGSTYNVYGDVSFSSVNLRMSKTPNLKYVKPAGLRFSGKITCDDEALFSSGSIAESGLLIAPNDYLSNGSELSLNSGVKYSKVVTSVWVNNVLGSFATSFDGIIAKNYERDFVSRGYMIVNYADGSRATLYSAVSTPTSVSELAYKTYRNKTVYNALSEDNKALIREYIGI